MDYKAMMNSKYPPIARRNKYMALNSKRLIITIGASLFLLQVPTLWSSAASQERRFLYFTSNENVDSIDCSSKGFEGIVIENRVTLSNENGGEITIVCPVLVFQKDALLVSMNDLSIKITGYIDGPARIIADSPNTAPPAIESNPSDTTTMNGVNGQTGRNLRNIKVCSNDFDTQAQAAMMNGTSGAPGNDGAQGEPGQDGLDGQAGHAVTLFAAGFSRGATIEITSHGSDGQPGRPGHTGRDGGAGGNGGRGANGRSALPCRPADDGGNGGNGGAGGSAGNGGNGGAGGKGGNGGAIRVTWSATSSPDPGFLKLNSKGGTGGRGGPPGEPGRSGSGGRGGLGGSGGLSFLLWPTGSNGRAGRGGARGAEGHGGTEGLNGRTGNWGVFSAGPLSESFATK